MPLDVPFRFSHRLIIVSTRKTLHARARTRTKCNLGNPNYFSLLLLIAYVLSGAVHCDSNS